MTRALLWFRRDLRLHDNPAVAAASAYDEVTALFVLDPVLFERAGRFRRRQLLAHLQGLDRSLAAAGGRLRIRLGDPEQIVVAEASSADAVFYNADVTPYARTRDNQVDQRLAEANIPVHRSWGTLVLPPGSVLTQKGTLSQVFTPFHKTWRTTALPPWPEALDCRFSADPGDPLPNLDQDPPMPGGEEAALDRLDQWLERVDDYRETHDLPAIDGTSQLSTDLRFGTLSPRHVMDTVGASSAGREAFVRQLAWRDWYAHLSHGHRGLAQSSVRPAYDAIVWRDDPDGLAAWKRGATGYPIVDAGMRQLNTTGFMHNRVRMITASFLVKDLLIDWRLGERYFRHVLSDADYSQNAGNWQWVAGTGPDAAPYFRVFNPVTQSKKFDAQGLYLRRWLPELSNVAIKDLHAPWLAAPLDLAAAGVTLGDTYPHPIVDHASARERALAAYKLAKGEA